MVMTVSTVRRLPPKTAGQNEKRGKTIGTVAGLGAGVAFENRPLSTLRNLDYVVSDIKPEKRNVAKLAATGVGLCIIGIIGVFGRILGGIIGKEVDRQVRIYDRKIRIRNAQNAQNQINDKNTNRPSKIPR